jgi:hypothetical protein
MSPVLPSCTRSRSGVVDHQLVLAGSLGVPTAVGRRQVAGRDVLGVEAELDLTGEHDLLLGREEGGLGNAFEI